MNGMPGVRRARPVAERRNMIEAGPARHKGKLPPLIAIGPAARGLFWKERSRLRRRSPQKKVGGVDHLVFLDIIAPPSADGQLRQ
jgi:hypothetical protein